MKQKSDTHHGGAQGKRFPELFLTMVNYCMERCKDRKGVYIEGYNN